VPFYTHWSWEGEGEKLAGVGGGTGVGRSSLREDEEAYLASVEDDKSLKPTAAFVEEDGSLEP
jgi:hypothetical protein